MLPNGFVNWLRDLDYGSVPAWLGAGSLLLAYRIFLRDRTATQRSQIDLLGVWMQVQWERRLPDGPIVDELQISKFIRNGSELPVDVVQVAYDITTRWWVRDLAQWRDDFPVWMPSPGTGHVRFYQEHIRVPPDETWRSVAEPVNVAHLAPEHADQIDLIKGGHYEIRWVLIADNAGRRWEVRPGRTARRLRWYSRRKRDYPHDWQHRHSIALRRLPHWIREKLEETNARKR